MNTFTFIISKIISAIISPDSFLLILLIVGLFFFIQKKLKLAKFFLMTGAFFLTIIAFFPVNEWVAYPLESKFPTNPSLPDKIDGIIVLSGSITPDRSRVWQQTEVNSASERLLSFIQLAEHFPDAKLIYTGGSGAINNQQDKAADYAQLLLASFPQTSSRVIFERESRTTYENAVNSFPLAQPKDSENWLLITSAQHMPRSVGLFCAQGWKVIPYPVDHNSSPGQLLRVELKLAEHLIQLKSAMHEWVGLIAHRLSGKTQALFPDAC